MVSIIVKATLTDQELQKFEAIQKKHGVRHKSEVIRICINRTYDDLPISKEG